MYGTVIATAWLTPSMVRVILGGPGLDAFAPVACTDAYINAAFAPPAAPYAAPFDLDRIRAEQPAELQPIRRRYTVRRWDADERLLTLDIVVHGAVGVGGAWAARAEPGDALVLTGPNGSYQPDPAADHHLLVGDESALPAIAASLEAMPAGADAHVRLLVDGPRYEVELDTPARLDLTWLHRNGDEDADAQRLLTAVRELDPELWQQRVQAFVHGEAGEVREVRRLLLGERLVARADLSCSPYWRRHHTDEAWRRVKADWNAEVARDVA